MERTTQPPNIQDQLDDLEAQENDAVEVAHKINQRWYNRKPDRKPHNVPQRRYPRMGRAFETDDLEFKYVPIQLSLSPQIFKNDENVWWYVSLFDNAPHGCYQTNEWIAEQLGIKPREVQRSINKLQKLGLMKRTLCFDRRAKSGRSLKVVWDFSHIIELLGQLEHAPDSWMRQHDRERMSEEEYKEMVINTYARQQNKKKRKKGAKKRSKERQ